MSSSHRLRCDLSAVSSRLASCSLVDDFNVPIWPDDHVSMPPLEVQLVSAAGWHRNKWLVVACWAPWT